MNTEKHSFCDWIRIIQKGLFNKSSEALQTFLAEEKKYGSPFSNESQKSNLTLHIEQINKKK